MNGRSLRDNRVLTVAMFAWTWSREAMRPRPTENKKKSLWVIGLGYCSTEEADLLVITGMRVDYAVIQK